MMQNISIALIQMSSTWDAAENLKVTSNYIREAASGGAKFILTPEMTNILDTNRKRMLPNTHFESDDPSLKAYLALAEDLKVWLLIGSMAIKAPNDMLYNRSYLIGSDGVIKAKYDKIHMFDVEFEGGETYKESSLYIPGKVAQYADTEFGRLGMTICYDIRFPSLFRTLAQNGVKFFSVPSAFTKITGEAHWHTLLRARAIETGSFILAPAQVGLHGNGRETYGHSLVVNPWGEILSCSKLEEGVLTANINFSEADKARARLPSLKADQAFELNG